MKTSVKSALIRLRLLISSAADSRVRTYPAPARVAVSPASAPGSGASTGASSRKSARASSLSRTSRAGRSSGSLPCAPTSKASATEPVPSRFLPQTSARPIFDGASSSSLLPTPTASSYGSNRGGANGRTGPVRLSLSALAKSGSLSLFATPTMKANQLSPAMRKWPGCRAWQLVHPPGPLHPHFVEWLMGFPHDWTDVERSETPSCPNAPKSSAA